MKAKKYITLMTLTASLWAFGTWVAMSVGESFEEAFFRGAIFLVWLIILTVSYIDENQKD